MTDAHRTETSLRISRVLAAPPERAFRTFTERIAEWWPAAYSLLGAPRDSVVIEPRVGGRWFERGADGSECVWGRVLEWDPPRRLALSWQIGVGFVPEADAERASRVDVRFEADGPDRTIITLTHDRFESHGSDWERMRESVSGEDGWPAILAQLETLIEEGSGSGSRGEFVGSDAVRFERILPGPVERVWDFLTDPHLRARWLAGGPMEPREGGRVELHFRHGDLSPRAEPVPERYRPYDGAVSRGRVTRFEPPHVLAYTWDVEEGEDSEVVFELEPRGERVRLVLTHYRLGDRRDVLLSVASGWHTHLDILVDVLAGAEPPPFWSAHEAHERAYERRLAEPA